MITLRLPTYRLRNLYLGHHTPMNRRTGLRKREHNRTPVPGGRIPLPQRPSFGFAKSGKLRDPMARGCFAGVGENLIGLISSQPSPGARATQAITLAGPNEVTFWRYYI